MYVVIVGAGVVGGALAEQLSCEGHRVSIVDRNRQRVRDLNNNLDVLAIYGDGALPSILRLAGIERSDMAIAVTSNDTVNMVVGMLAKRMGAEHQIVRIRNTEYTCPGAIISPQDLGVDHVVNPEPHIVASLKRMMDFPGTYDFATLAEGQVEMFGFHIPESSPVIGRSLKQMRQLGDLNAFLILYIKRRGNIIVPHGDDTIQKGDGIHCLVSPNTLQFLLPMLFAKPDRTERVVIVGATRVGVELARNLEGSVKHIWLIEKDHTLAQEAAPKLKKTTVLCADATDPKVLEEASIDRCNYFCALSENDQRNTFAALLASKHGARHTAVLAQHPKYVPVLDSLGVDIILNPQLTIVGDILRYVRRGHVFSVIRLAEDDGEIIEMRAAKGCKATAKPLKGIRFPKNAIIGAIVRDGDMQIPNGDTHIKPGDRVLVYARHEAIGAIERLFCR